MISCIIIDDEPLAVQVMEYYVKQFKELSILQTFTDPFAAVQFANSRQPQLVFTDIEMPDMRGTNLVQQLTYKPMVIFTTAYKNYAVEGFELEALDYLVKPISFERFGQAVQRALKQGQVSERASSFLHVRSEYNLVRIPFADIEYIESLEDYLKIYIANNKPIMTLMTMKAVMDKLGSSRDFVRTHRSFIVSVSKVKSFLNRKLVMNSGIEIPVSLTYLEELKKCLA